MAVVVEGGSGATAGHVGATAGKTGASRRRIEDRRGRLHHLAPDAVPGITAIRNRRLLVTRTAPR